ncbi:MAG TPA: NAD(P)/FAD-dependent oxidoreductase [Candidatus Aquicultor sp.]|jgi:phytoene dehydrogenase-like protein
MSDKSIIIIGAGIGGLCTGCYAQMNGYQSQIFEMHNKPGGLCTAWKRNGYTFDGCIHWLTGSGPGMDFYDWWLELGALQNRTIIDSEYFIRFEGRDGNVMYVYSDIDKFEQHLKELAPEDSAVIEELARDVRTMSKHVPPMGKPRELMGLFDMIKMLPDGVPYIRAFNKYTGITLEQFAQRFTNEFVREAFLNFFSVADEAASGLVMTLVTFNLKTGGYPVGGSLEFSKAIEQRYLDLGGNVQYKSPVEKILVEDDRAVGVRLADGTEHRADIVVSAADGRATIFDMLDGKYVGDEIQSLYKTLTPYQSAVQISLGIARDLSNEPHSQVFPLREPLVVGATRRDYLMMRHFCSDPTMAPTGKSVITAIIPCDYDSWDKLKAAGDEKYQAAKEAIAKAIIGEIEARYPGITEQIETVDVVTPVTYTRYTGTWKGSFMSWFDSPEANKIAWGKGIPNKLPGLASFYMVGQWVSIPGGVPVGLMTGRNLIQVLCRNDKKRFATTKP